MYYRLGLYKIDRLCSNETANLLKVSPPCPVSTSSLADGGVERVDSVGLSVGSDRV